MSTVYNILVPYFTRSEYGPLEPLFKVAEQQPFKNLLTLTKYDFRAAKENNLFSYRNMETVISSMKGDMVVCGYDRPEMARFAYDWYHLHPNIPMCQVYAGDIAGGAWDDRDRFAISQYADLIFCATESSYDRVRQSIHWRMQLGQYPDIKLSGATHYDDMTTKGRIATAIPKFALVLYNRPSLLSIDQMMVELEEMGRWLTSHYGHIYWATPNGDEGSKEILDFAKRLRYTKVLPEMPRDEFLWMVSKASVFVGNSSALFYEAPFFDTPIKQFGMRNRWREPMKNTSPGASAKILNAIYTYLEWEGKK